MDQYDKKYNAKVGRLTGKLNIKIKNKCLTHKLGMLPKG